LFALMKVAMVGCGAVGSYYGAKLCRAGHEVHCLLRSDYAVVEQRGLEIRSVDGDFTVRPRVAREPGTIGTADVVFVALKSTANGILPGLLPPVVGPSSLVVSLENGLGDEEQMAEVVGADRVLGGLCFVCLNRIAPGVVLHTAHGLIVLGEHGRRPLPRTEALAEALRGAGIPCRVAQDLALAHWEKLVWNIPFNGLGVAGAAGWESVRMGEWRSGSRLGPVLPTDRLLADARWEALVRELMDEVVAAARAQGHVIDAGFAHQQVERTRVMGSYRASTLLDFEQGKALELESMFLEPLRRAQRAGANTPRLAALCRVLRALNPKETGSS
jgi:2-dehydropantoate 2-reductase